MTSLYFILLQRLDSLCSSPRQAPRFSRRPAGAGGALPQRGRALDAVRVGRRGRGRRLHLSRARLLQFWVRACERRVRRPVLGRRRRLSGCDGLYRWRHAQRCDHRDDGVVGESCALLGAAGDGAPLQRSLLLNADGLGRLLRQPCDGGWLGAAAVDAAAAAAATVKPAAVAAAVAVAVSAAADAAAAIGPTDAAAVAAASGAVVTTIAVAAAAN